MEKRSSYRISTVAGLILGIAALVADLFTLIPFVGDFVGPIFWVLASFYFWKKGMGIVTGKQGVTKIISTVAELIPGVQELPTIFAAMLAIIVMMRFEDKTGIPASSAIGGKPNAKINVAGVRQPPPQIPLNREGVRPPNGGLPA